eukprot:2097628-Pleurochrysis_carterae.AAC.4
MLRQRTWTSHSTPARVKGASAPAGPGAVRAFVRARSTRLSPPREQRRTRQPCATGQAQPRATDGRASLRTRRRRTSSGRSSGLTQWYRCSCC